MQRYDDDDERPSPSASLAPLAPPYAYAYDTAMVLNARLAVRRTIAQMIATPQQTVRSVVAAAAGNGNGVVGSNCQQLNVVDPIRRLVSLHLETIYERLQCEIVSSNVHPPSSVSVMRFLQLHPGESTKEIVERFEMRSMDRRIHERDEWRNICITPLQELKECAKPANVPPLDRKALNSGTCSSNSSSNNKSKSSSKSAKHEMVRSSSSSSLVISDRDAIDSYGSSIISNDKLLSQSSANSSLCGQESSAKSYSLSCRQLEETDTKEDSSNQLEQKNQLDELAKKVTAQLMADVDFLKQLHDGAFSLIRLNNNNNTNTAEGYDERTALMEQIQRITSQHILPAILSKRSLIPSEPCTVVGDYYPTSTSQQQHLQNDDKVNGETKPSSFQRCQKSNEMSDCFVTPVAKTSTIDVSFPTEPCKEDSQQRHIKMVDVGVNTNDDDDGVCAKIMEEKEDVDDDGSTSSNIAEDLSAGEIPQQLFESISQKQPVNLVTIRPDGSLVPNKETPIKRPFAREWFPCPRQLFRHSTSIDSSFAMRSVQIIKSFSAEDDEIECVSAKTASKHSSPSAKDSNSTLAPISPIPHHC